MNFEQKRIIRELIEQLRSDSISTYDVLGKLLEVQKIERTQLSHIWNVEDVLFKAEDLDITLTEDQAIEILRNIEDDIDCSVGVNWDVIEYHINWYSSGLK